MSVAASAQAPSAANGTKARPLSPRAELVFTVGLYLSMATFAVAVCGLMIVAGASTREGRDGRGERRGKRDRERERERKRLKVSAFPGFQLLVVLFSCVTTREKNPTNTPTHPHTHTDVENTSWLSHTTLGAKVRPLLTRKPFLVGGFFNTGAFGAVMAYARLHEHQRYLEDEREKEAAAASAQPKSRQERRRAEADRSKEASKTRKQVEESMRAMGARVFVEKGGKDA